MPELWSDQSGDLLRQQLAEQIKRMLAEEEDEEEKERQRVAKEQAQKIKDIGFPIDEQFSDPGKGIYMGEISADKLKKIRDQAAVKFPGATGGNFISAEMTPEVAARLAANEAYVADQPYRDAQFMLGTREVRERAPKEAVESAEGLMQMAQQQRRDREEAAWEKMLDAGKLPNGKISYDAAQNLYAMNPGKRIPAGMTGKSRTQAESQLVEFDQMVYAAKIRASDPTKLYSNDQKEMINELENASMRARKMLEQGADPEMVSAFLQEEEGRIARHYAGKIDLSGGANYEIER